MDPVLIGLIILGIIILSIIIYVIVKFFKFFNALKKQPLIGGCRGTRYGCCPRSNIAKHDPSGTNCN